ncbi:GNAT family N-acetyltransferase [Paracoccus denitrificans]|jgi:predicted GNAT family acetyltransferase|uniref:N-acetyltransferase domain-containing protein n=1 Tax=Paracoccus denitrificans (strain Pd 1222) TaxID=318586 RepID=A1AY69_PARDP|nr:N-acetyltransferase [Paracoccus denitrificans]ABL68213.1 conserved hypothetical protein [Paracoccus denitrificans PD1222]MBB4629839.1 hypothetical protein [Paracoccus denitrificans]MCU7430839.1 N-acetyltransferase [Paracoccus denitrificans]QAR26318.1 N-acetyltransferase [Paracoccus denitrificans]UPV95241.1 N-acetyltransferase [Paracoccus denitrificans]
MQIRYEEVSDKARYIACPKGECVELVVTEPEPGMRVAYYTAIPGGREDRAIARALIQRLVEDARIRGQVVVPLCPFVRAEAQKNPDWSDVIRH